MELGVATYDWQSQPMDPGDSKSHGPTHEKDLALWQYLWTIRKTLAKESTEFTLNVRLHPGRIILHVFSFWRKKVTFLNFFKISRASVTTVCVYVLRRVWLLESPLTAACRAPLFTEFPRQEYQSELPFPPPEDLPSPGIKPTSPTLASGFFTAKPPEELNWYDTWIQYSGIKTTFLLKLAWIITGLRDKVRFWSPCGWDDSWFESYLVPETQICSFGEFSHLHLRKISVGIIISPGDRWENSNWTI